MLSRRFLHSSARTTGRLVNASVSVDASLGVAPPPAPLPPLERTFTPTRPARATAAPAVAALKPIRRNQPTPAQAHAPEVPHRPEADGESVLAWRLANRAARRSTGASEQLQREEEELQTAAQLDLFLLRSLSQFSATPPPSSDVGGEAGRARLTSLPELVKQRRETARTVIETAVLEYEPTPSPLRRVRLDGKAGPVQEAVDAADEQDGTVVVAHVLGGKESRVSVCSGFAVGKVGAGEGQMVMTCAHTLDGMEQHLDAAAPGTPSATFVLTSSGHAYTVDSILSSLPGSDLLVLRLSPRPINPSTIPVRRLRSLPVNPYPSPTTSSVSVHRYLNPLSRLRRKLQKLPEREWDEGRVVEYHDSRGRTAETGTYDELGMMWLDATPTPGSSGGPVVCRKTGSVVGVTRGSSHKYGERRSYGFATPAEKIFELFPLPHFKTTAQRQAEREAAAAAAAAAATAAAPKSAGATVSPPPVIFSRFTSSPLPPTIPLPPLPMSTSPYALFTGASNPYAIPQDLRDKLQGKTREPPASFTHPPPSLTLDPAPSPGKTHRTLTDRLALLEGKNEMLLDGMSRQALRIQELEWRLDDLVLKGEGEKREAGLQTEDSEEGEKGKEREGEGAPPAVEPDVYVPLRALFRPPIDDCVEMIPSASHHGRRSFAAAILNAQGSAPEGTAAPAVSRRAGEAGTQLAGAREEALQEDVRRAEEAQAAKEEDTKEEEEKAYEGTSRWAAAAAPHAAHCPGAPHISLETPFETQQALLHRRDLFHRRVCGRLDDLLHPGRAVGPVMEGGEMPTLRGRTGLGAEERESRAEGDNGEVAEEKKTGDGEKERPASTEEAAADETDFVFVSLPSSEDGAVAGEREKDVEAEEKEEEPTVVDGETPLTAIE
ncbi:hypothetical protein JCM6882_005780 [Rhodosporidiobolus microsporus]